MADGSLGEGLGVRAPGRGLQLSATHSPPPHAAATTGSKHKNKRPSHPTPLPPRFPHRCQRRLAPRKPRARTEASAAAPRAGSQPPAPRAGQGPGGAAPAEQHRGARGLAIRVPSPSTGGDKPLRIGVLSRSTRGGCEPPVSGTRAAASRRCEPPPSGSRVPGIRRMRAPGMGSRRGVPAAPVRWSRAPAPEHHPPLLPLLRC